MNAAAIEISESMAVTAPADFSDPAARFHRQILDLAPDAIIIRDAEERVTFWNRSAERFYGWTAEEACGRLLPDLICRNRGERERAFARVAATGEWTGELHEADRNGRELLVWSRWKALADEDGTVAAVLTINTDLTAQKLIEAQWLRAQRLETIGTLAGGVAHDLNNILTPIVLSAPMLRENLPPDVREMIVSTIESSAERAAGMVNQVLTFARGVEGERVLLVVRHLIKDAVRRSRETFPKSIHVSADALPELWPILGDANQLRQVLSNLCENAREAMPDGGELLLTAANAVLDESYASMVPGAAPGRYVVVCVTDTGSGIAREMLDRIFDPFFTTKEIGKGTGLGLSAALGIVRSHGGFMRVESEIRRGSQFRLYLPASPQSNEESSPIVPDRSSLVGRGELVLVVDDEVSICQVTARLLTQHGYRVETACDGTGALARFAQAHGAVRVVLTDLRMPFMDGFTLIRTLKRMDPRVLVIASTGHGYELEKLDLEKLQANATLRKPYTRETLLTALSGVLSEARSSSDASPGPSRPRDLVSSENQSHAPLATFQTCCKD